MTDKKNTLVWGGLYEVRHSTWNNDQSYGLAIPVRDKNGCACMVDTSEVHPTYGPTEKAIDRVLAASDPDVGRFLISGTFDYYHHNVQRVDEDDLGRDYELLCDLHDYRPLEMGESVEDYATTDYVSDVKLYHEHGYPYGISLIRKGATKDANRALEHLANKVCITWPDGDAFNAAYLANHLDELIRDGAKGINRRTLLSAVERLQQTNELLAMRDAYVTFSDKQDKRRADHERKRTQERFELVPGDAAPLESIDGMTDYLENHCYDPNEIRDLGSNWYRSFSPQSLMKPLAHDDMTPYGRHFAVIAKNWDETDLRIIMFARDDDGAIEDAASVDVTDENIEAVTDYVMHPSAERRQLTSYVDDEDTDDLISAAQAAIDAFDSRRNH